METTVHSLEEVRAFLAKKKSHSHTSRQFQADVLETVINCLGSGDCVIEIGTFKGGLSCQLAFLLEGTGKRLVLVDISEDYIAWTEQLIRDLCIKTDVLFFVGSFQDFVDQNPEVRPAFIVVDGDHSYEGVAKDIDAIKGIVHMPPAVAFHDFSLRHCRSHIALDHRVDRAIVDQFLGCGFRYKEIGVAGDDAFLQRISGVLAAGADYHYHDSSSPEGILVVTDEDSFRKAAPWIWKSLQTWIP